MKRIGIIVPDTNYVIEDEIIKLYEYGIFCTKDVIFHISRIKSNKRYFDDKEGYLNDLVNNQETAVDRLGKLELDDIVFGCTAASFFNNNEKIYINPKDSIINCCKEKNIKKCMLITPYNNVLTDKLVSNLEQNKIIVKKTIALDLLHSADYVEYGYSKLKDLIKKKYQKEYGEIVISCTNFPTFHLLKELTKELNIKIVTSNQSLIYELISKHNLKIKNDDYKIIF